MDEKATEKSEKILGIYDVTMWWLTIIMVALQLKYLSLFEAYENI